MSRPISNSGLAALCTHTGLEIEDVALKCGCTVRAVHYYSTGRKRMPRLEKKLAALFGITVPALRRKLGLPPTPTEEPHDNDPNNTTEAHAL